MADSAEGKEKLLITVSVDGNTLKIQPKGQARLLATPESETRFYLKATDATLEFAKDSKGIVNQLTLLQGNRNIKAARVEPAGTGRLRAGNARRRARFTVVQASRTEPGEGPRSRTMTPSWSADAADAPLWIAGPFCRGRAAASGRWRWRISWGPTRAPAGSRRDDDKPRPELNGGLHHRARATRVVQLFMSGAASQCDTFDYKPALLERNGRKFDPGGKVELFQSEPGAVMASPWKWRQYGQCGQWVSDLLPHLATCVDDIAFLPAMVSKSNVHGPATFMQSTGFVLPGFPSVGAWVSYGLGSLSENLPTFVVLPDSRGFAPNGPANWSAGFLPAANQGTMVRPGARNPIFDLFPPEDAGIDARGAERRTFPAESPQPRP